MEYVSKKLSNTLSVTGIVNLHFFEFDRDFSTDGEEHPFYELVFVNSGRLLVTSEDYTGTLRKNEMIIHRQNSTHSLRCHTDNAPSVIIIGFECDSTLIDAFSYAPTELDATAIRRLAEIVKEGRGVFKPPYNIPVYDMKKKRHTPLGAEQMLRILLEYFLIRLLRGQATSELAEEVGERTLMVQEIIDYVSDNYRERITIDELAFIFRTNRATLCKEFKGATGKTVIEFINDKKFEVAKTRILTTSESFTSISEYLNFESIHYFTRFFKKMSGLSPSEFRRKSRSE